MKQTYSSLKSRVLGILFSSVLALALFSSVKSSPAYSMDLQAGFRMGLDFSESTVFTDSLMFMPLDLGLYWKIIPNLYIGSNLVWYWHSEDDYSIHWISVNLDSTYRFLRLMKNKLQLYAKLEIGIFNYLSVKLPDVVAEAYSGYSNYYDRYDLSETGSKDFISVSSFDPKIDGLKWNITQPNFRIGAGVKWKLKKKLYVYSEALISMFTVEVEGKDYWGKTTKRDTSFKALLFTGGIFYTI